MATRLEHIRGGLFSDSDPLPDGARHALEPPRCPFSRPDSAMKLSAPVQPRNFPRDNLGGGAVAREDYQGAGCNEPLSIYVNGNVKRLSLST